MAKVVSEAAGWVSIRFVNISLVLYRTLILLLLHNEVREESLPFPGSINFLSTRYITYASIYLIIKMYLIRVNLFQKRVIGFITRQ